jgi:hypothetical protein
MAKMTLLEMVQDILNDMDSDEVNSIDDTLEARQVAQVIRTTYYDLIATRDWPHLNKFIQLESLSDSSKPNYLKIPENVQYVKWIKYDMIDPASANPKRKLQDIVYKDPEQFVSDISQRNSLESNITEVYDDTVGPLLIRNDKNAEYYTIVDDEHIIFDSYNSDVESVLQSTKVVAHGVVEPAFNIVDDFTPDLPSKHFPYLLSESKSVSFNVINQAANPKEEQRARRHRTWMARNKRSQNKGAIAKTPDYGRKGRGYVRTRRG